MLRRCLDVGLARRGVGVLLAFLLAYFGGRGEILCSVLLLLFTLQYEACCLAISSAPRVSDFLSVAFFMRAPLQ